MRLKPNQTTSQGSPRKHTRADLESTGREAAQELKNVYAYDGKAKCLELFNSSKFFQDKLLYSMAFLEELGHVDGFGYRWEIFAASG